MEQGEPVSKSEAELRRHLQQKQFVDNVSQAMQSLVNTTNSMAMEDEVAKGIADGLMRSHRTLQQSFFRSFKIAMKQYADEAGSDLRNQESVKFAKKISEMDDYFPFV